MPRDANGNYTLPAGNPVIAGTIITADWANATMPDLGNEVTNSLSREGEGGMLAPLKHTNGSELLPSVAFLNDIQSGLYLGVAGQVIMTISGTNVMRWSSGTVEIWNGSSWEPLTGGTFFPGSDPDLAGGNGAIQIGGADVSTDEFIAIGPTTIQVKDGPTGVGTFLDLNTLGGSVRVGPAISGAGTVGLFFDTAEKLRTTNEGVNVFGNFIGSPAAGANQDALLNLRDAANNPCAQMGFLTAPELQLKNFVHGGSVVIKGENTATGAEVSFIDMDPDADIEVSPPSGIVRVSGSSPNTPHILFDDGSMLGLMGYVTGSDILTIQNETGQGIQLLSAGPVGPGGEIMLHARANGAVDLYHNGIITIQTAAAASGGAIVNNTLTGTGNERVLTLSDLNFGVVGAQQFISTGTATDVTGVVWTFPSAGTYEIKVYIPFFLSGTDPTGLTLWLAWLAGTQPLASLTSRIYQNNLAAAADTRVFLNTAISSYFAALVADTPAANQMAVIEGTVTVTGTPPTLQLQAAPDFTTAGTLNIRDGVAALITKIA